MFRGLEVKEEDDLFHVGSSHDEMQFSLRKACCLSVRSRSLFLPQIETAYFEIQVIAE